LPEIQTPQTQPVSDCANNAPAFEVLSASSRYPFDEMNEMAEFRDVTLSNATSKEPSKSCADDEVCKKPTFSRPLETKHSFETRGYDTDYHKPAARIAISEIPASRPVVSDLVIAPKPFSGTTEDPEA
jgi:hypothetical protein